MKGPLYLLLFLATWTSTGRAQDADSLAVIAKLPNCAQLCLVTSIVDSPCQLTNSTCICTNSKLQAAVEKCVISSCTIRESLTTKNVTSTFCHAPVRSETTHLRVSNIVMCVVTISCAISRLVYHRYLTITGLGWDDYIVAVTVLISVPSVVIIDRGMLTNGIGVDLWTVPFDHLENFVRWLYTLTLLYFIQSSLVKVSLILFFLRIFPRRRTVQLLWGTIAFIIVWTISFFIPGSCPCLPLTDYWTAWDKAKPTECLNIYAVIWAHAIICIVVDIWMLCIPLYEVFHLQMRFMKKFSVALMFFVGTFVTVVSILRLRSLISFGGTSNVTWAQTNVVLWSVYEINVGIICACMPALRLILIRAFPTVISAIQGSTQRSGKNHLGSGGRGTKGNVDTIGSAKSRKENVIVDLSTIAYTTTFSLRLEENDEADLVSIEEFSESTSRARGDSYTSELSL
ncbi:hypothetical protein ACET3X_002550 [Alternaria dauci]|uniref:CFEM domain-containing protein n=1 Tax=Alternaria dauci TaxID=48095 RepID=A0ABR3UPV6_9PLEO